MGCVRYHKAIRRLDALELTGQTSRAQTVDSALGGQSSARQPPRNTHTNTQSTRCSLYGSLRLENWVFSVCLSQTYTTVCLSQLT